MSIRLIDNLAQNRFEIFSDELLAGICEYSESDNAISFTHTEVFSEFKGKGFASLLIRFALDEMKTKGVKVLPFCSFVRDFIAKHPDDYLQLVVLDQRGKFGLPN